MDESEENRRGDRNKWRDLVAFWIFGLCNNYGYVVMLTAAEDIINSKIVRMLK
jgi:battenin